VKTIRFGVRFAPLSRVSVTLLLPLMFGGLSLGFAPLPPPPWWPLEQPEKKERKEKRCTCQEIRDYAKTVENKLNAYKRITRKKMHFKTYGDYRAQFEIEMGWTQSWSEGKGGLAATDSEKETALQACRKEHCDWICDVSIWGVHEKYHPWFDHSQMPESVVIEGILDAVSGGRERAMDHYIAGELGAHDLELRFLQDNLRQAQDRDKCEGLQGTPSDSELEARFRVSRTRMTNYIRSWQK
jgi:hypothetical protein